MATEPIATVLSRRCSSCGVLHPRALFAARSISQHQLQRPAVQRTQAIGVRVAGGHAPAVAVRLQWHALVSSLQPGLRRSRRVRQHRLDPREVPLADEGLSIVGVAP